MIRLYLLDCSPLLDRQVLASVLPHLDTDRRAKTDRLHPPEKKAQSAAAGLLLRHLFGEAQYTYGEHGKPYLKDLNRYFSLSHSGNWVACAVSDAEVGVDIQPLSPIRPAVMRRCFTPEEKDWIGNNPEHFTRLWTMKEAYMKMTGTGLSVPAKEINLSMPPKDGYDPNNDCYWSFGDVGGIPTTLCSKENLNLEIERVEVSQLVK